MKVCRTWRQNDVKPWSGRSGSVRASFGVGDEAERRGRIWRVYRALGLVGAVFTLGTAGFYILTEGEYSLLECLYMTVITLSTVGFGEVIPIRGSTVMMTYTIFLTLFGMGTVLFFLTAVTAMVVEGDLLYRVWRRRMGQIIDELNGHVLVTGAGRSGIHALRELLSAKTPVVVIERDPERMEHILAEFGVRSTPRDRRCAGGRDPEERGDRASSWAHRGAPRRQGQPFPLSFGASDQSGPTAGVQGG